MIFSVAGDFSKIAAGLRVEFGFSLAIGFSVGIYFGLHLFFSFAVGFSRFLSRLLASGFTYFSVLPSASERRLL